MQADTSRQDEVCRDCVRVSAGWRGRGDWGGPGDGVEGACVEGEMGGVRSLLAATGEGAEAPR